MKGKKANAIVEGITIVIVLVVFGMIALIGFKPLSEINSVIQDEADFSNDTKTLSASYTSRYPNLFEGLFVFLVVGLWISALIFSFLVDTHPIFLVLSIILLAVVLFVTAITANAYGVIATNPDFATEAAQFPTITFVISHMVETVLVIATSIILVLFGKNKFS